MRLGAVLKRVQVRCDRIEGDVMFPGSFLQELQVVDTLSAGHDFLGKGRVGGEVVISQAKTDAGVVSDVVEE